VSDIFREVEEEVRQERLQQWWKKYGNFVVAGVSILVIAVAGWKLWERYDQQQRMKASGQIESAAAMSAAGQADLAAQAYAQIAKKAPSGYALLAQLSQADEMLASGRTNDAVALYMKVAESDKAGIGQVARMRAAWAQGDKLSSEELKTLLAPLNDGKSEWRFMARELLAYRALHDNAADAAGKEFAALAADKDAPASLRQRAEAMATLIRTSGGKDYGTVPPPAKPDAAASSAEGTKTP
jgi:hypothetical protein